MNWQALRIAVVGPLPPPAGGMAGQTQQLVELLRAEGAEVMLIQTNAPYWPRALARVRGLRAVPRLVGYVARLWRAAGTVQLMHVMANSGWSWHLFAAPAIWIGRLRRTPVVVNYRGGEARAFLERSGRWVRPSMRAASVLAVPSGFLEQVFASFGFATQVVPNIVDLDRFRPDWRDTESLGMERNGSAAATQTGDRAFCVLVTRNLEAIYDIGTALRAFALVLAEVPGAKLVIAGSGPERDALQALAGQLGIADAVEFTGRLDRQQMAARYRHAEVMLNPSRVDNMPNSVLEALASGVPIVSTNVGGVPHIVANEKTALLVPVGEPRPMADAIVRLNRDRDLAAKLAKAGLAEVQRYTWPRVQETLGALYSRLLEQDACSRKVP